MTEVHAQAGHRLLVSVLRGAETLQNVELRNAAVNTGDAEAQVGRQSLPGPEPDGWSFPKLVWLVAPSLRYTPTGKQLRLRLERVFQRDRFGVRMEVTRQGYEWQPLRFFLVVVVVGVVALEGDTLGDINGNTGRRLVPVQSLG